MEYSYNANILGDMSMEKERPELNRLKELGYEFDDARDVVDIFEKKVAKFAGCKYAVTTDCCSHGLFLSLKYIQRKMELVRGEVITIPRRTYISVPMQIDHADFTFDWEDLDWSGIYQLKPTRVWDSATRWTEGMYVGGDALQVISFQFKKRIPIGKGGIILTDDEEAYNMLKLMSYDGRDLPLAYDDPNHVKTLGYHMYMTPEDAARGIILMDMTPTINEDICDTTNYLDVEEIMKNIGY